MPVVKFMEQKKPDYYQDVVRDLTKRISFDDSKAELFVNREISRWTDAKIHKYLRGYLSEEQYYKSTSQPIEFLRAQVAQRFITQITFDEALAEEAVADLIMDWTQEQMEDYVRTFMKEKGAGRINFLNTLLLASKRAL